MREQRTEISFYTYFYVPCSGLTHLFSLSELQLLFCGTIKERITTTNETKAVFVTGYSGTNSALYDFSSSSKMENPLSSVYIVLGSKRK